MIVVIGGKFNSNFPEVNFQFFIQYYIYISIYSLAEKLVLNCKPETLLLILKHYESINVHMDKINSNFYSEKHLKSFTKAHHHSFLLSLVL